MRENNEEADNFVTRFTTAVTSYVNQTTPLSNATSRQLAILMLRNANLSPDSMNSIIFQLTNAKNSEEAEFADISVPKPLFPKLSALIHADTEFIDSTSHASLKALCPEMTE